jgi:hypothetical protein
MSTTRQLDRENQKSVAGSAPEARPALSRRVVLSGAASAFALAASGLLLPERLVEAADHPARRLQQRKEQRRGKQRHALERRREQRRDRRKRGRHENENGNKDELDQGFYKNIKFNVEVSGGRSVFVKLYQYDLLGWEDPGDPSLQGTFAPGASHTFPADWHIAALRIDNNLWIKADNTGLPWENPRLWLGYGGSFGRGDGFGTGTSLILSVLNVGGVSGNLERDGYSVQATRQADDNFNKVFNVKIVSPNP